MTARRFASIVACAGGIVLASTSGVRAESYAGFRLGANNASLTGSSVDSLNLSDPRLGFSGGAFIGTDYGKGLGFRIDLMYTQKGATGSDSTGINLDYLELGTLFVYRFKLTETFTLRAFAGPVAGLWINAEADFGPYDQDLGEVIEHWEFSGTIGAEFDMKAGPYVLLLEARYTQGTQVFDGKGLEDQPVDLDAANTGISVMTGVAVPF
jgi:hypothetical protein